ncbi:MAG: hypothetical protein Q9169_007182 [Polycauliona sp. 2 TL-2023]
MPTDQTADFNWDYCNTAIDVVCSTLAFKISASDNEPEQFNIGTGQLEGQGVDCFAQASNGKVAAAIFPYDVCIQRFDIITGCEVNKQWDSYDDNCVGGTINIIINGLDKGTPVNDTMPAFVLGTMGDSFGKDAPEPGIPPKLKGGTSERPNEGIAAKSLSTASKGTATGKSGASLGVGRVVGPGRGVSLGA